MRNHGRQAIFFEFDGVLAERPTLAPDGRVPYFPGALEALTRLDHRTFLLFIGTNREDIAFGRLRERDFKKCCDRFLADCEVHSIPIRKIYSCPYHPKGRTRFRKDSVFRKPAPGMFKMAQQEFDLDLSRSWIVGHTTTDVLAGSRAGMGTMLVRTGEGGRDGRFQVEPHRIARDLPDALQQIREFELSLRN